MAIIDALIQVFAFFQAQLYEGFVPQGNDEAFFYNFFLVVSRLFALIGF